MYLFWSLLSVFNYTLCFLSQAISAWYSLYQIVFHFHMPTLSHDSSYVIVVIALKVKRAQNIWPITLQLVCSFFSNYTPNILTEAVCVFENCTITKFVSKLSQAEMKWLRPMRLLRKICGSLSAQGKSLKIIQPQKMRRKTTSVFAPEC